MASMWRLEACPTMNARFLRPCIKGHIQISTSLRTFLKNSGIVFESFTLYLYCSCYSTSSIVRLFAPCCLCYLLNNNARCYKDELVSEFDGLCPSTYAEYNTTGRRHHCIPDAPCSQELPHSCDTSPQPVCPCVRPEKLGKQSFFLSTSHDNNIHMHCMCPTHCIWILPILRAQLETGWKYNVAPKLMTICDSRKHATKCVNESIGGRQIAAQTAFHQWTQLLCTDVCGRLTAAAEIEIMGSARSRTMRGYQQLSLLLKVLVARLFQFQLSVTG